jgi:hypothetical protein
LSVRYRIPYLKAILGCRQGTVFVHGKLAGGAGFAIEAPGGHMRLECRLEGRHQLLELLQRNAGQIQKLCGAGLHIGKS